MEKRWVRERFGTEYIDDSSTRSLVGLGEGSGRDKRLSQGFGNVCYWMFENKS